VGVREQPVPLVVKEGQKNVQVRQFNKEASVFAPWKEDDEAI